MKANIKAYINIIPIMLCILLLILPILELIGLLNGLDFFLHNEILIVILQTVLTVGATVTLFVLKPEFDITGMIFLILLAPVGILNALCFADCEWGWSIFFAIVWASCCFAMYFKFVPDSTFKATSAVFSVLLAVALVVLYGWNIIYGSFVNERDIKSTYPSMDGTYVAELGTSKSLIGTKTTVYIAKAEPICDLFFAYYQAKPAKIYEGEEHEVKIASISWLDDSTVIVNDRAYRSITPQE